jgi:hypothetical protein
MFAIREIQTVENGELHLQLPQEFWGKSVEVIVLSATIDPTPIPKKSLRGILKQFAQPERLTQEKMAWQSVLEEKYDTD